MNVETYHITLQATAIIIAILCFSFLLIVAINYNPDKLVVTYERIYGALTKQKRRWFDYEKNQKFLSKKGASFHLGKKIDPIRFYSLSFLISAFCIFIGARYHFLASLVLAIYGFFIPKIYILRSNKQDNEKMLSDINMVFCSLELQISSGVSIITALTECYGNVRDKRLRAALEDLSLDLIVEKDVKEAINSLQSKFDNRKIDSLCSIILQEQESGQAVDLLISMSEQIKDMQKVLLDKEKANLRIKITMLTVGIVMVLTGIVLYALGLEIYTIASTI